MRPVCEGFYPEQHVETQLYDLRQLATQRGFKVVAEYTDKYLRHQARRPGLDALMADARRRKYSVLLVAAFDRSHGHEAFFAGHRRVR